LPRRPKDSSIDADAPPIDPPAGVGDAANGWGVETGLAPATGVPHLVQKALPGGKDDPHFMQNCAAMIMSWIPTSKNVTQDAGSSGGMTFDPGVAVLVLERRPDVETDAITVEAVSLPPVDSRYGGKTWVGLTWGHDRSPSFEARF